MNLIKTLMGRRQFLVSAGTVSALALVLGKLYKLADQVFKTNIASAAESKATDIKKPDNLKSASEPKEVKGVQRNPTRKSGIHYDYIMNGYDLPPEYIQHIVERQRLGAVAWGAPSFSFNENQQPGAWRTGSAHGHAYTEYFIFYGVDPVKPDDIGGIIEFWIGQGEDAEPYIIDKPTIIAIPPYTPHLPQVFREGHGIGGCTVIFDAPLNSSYKIEEKPAGFNVKKQADPTQFSRKYQNFVNKRDISRATYYPSHEGKAQVILHQDARQNRLVTHVTEVNLISGAGIGWGCGDMMHIPEMGSYYQVRSMPHIHDVVETWCFVGTDPEHPDDLGGTIEFWIGEGGEARKQTITKPTIMFIPPNTVHLPMWVSEVHKPIITMNVLDEPIWAIYYSDVFPSAFEHETIPPESKGKVIQLNYDKGKCLYPECRLCVDNCQVQGINLSVDPPVVGNPCLSCLNCASLCPTDAITYELVDKK